MIAVDTSTLLAFLRGEKGGDVSAMMSALRHGEIALPPLVLTKLLSEESLDDLLVEKVSSLPVIETGEGYWTRAGQLRAGLRAKGVKAKLPETLIVQSCLDHDIGFITRDKAYAPYAEHCGLRLV